MRVLNACSGGAQTHKDSRVEGVLIVLINELLEVLLILLKIRAQPRPARRIRRHNINERLRAALLHLLPVLGRRNIALGSLAARRLIR